MLDELFIGDIRVGRADPDSLQCRQTHYGSYEDNKIASNLNLQS